MVENDADTNNSPSQNNDTNNTSAGYLKSAAAACSAGDAVLAMHLYLAAFEKAVRGTYMPDPAAIDGLRQAWQLACKLKERSLGEYIFEKLEPYLAPDEVAQCAEELQRLALDKLEEFGLTREDLDDMTDMISQDFLGFGSAPGLVKVEHRQGSGPLSLVPIKHLDPTQMMKPVNPPSGQPGNSGLPGSSGQATGTIDPTESIENLVSAFVDSNKAAESAPLATPGVVQPHYRDIVGYTQAIKTMQGFGVGMQNDKEFQELVETLNVRHGLKKMPIVDTYLFQAPVREDANQFMAATVSEVGLPVIRMLMEENIQGMPVLCVMAQTDNQPKLNAARNAFEGGGVLVLEDIDLWGSPLSEAATDTMGSFMYSQLSRGAREAINLIRSAVENPEVYVFASSASSGEVDGFFFDVLEPISLVDIEDPTPAERADLWAHVASEHPSMRAIDQAELVRYSAKMSRFDIYMAAREAVEDAYKASLVARSYVPVTSDGMYEKLAAYQPLDSAEYQQLEDAVVEDFRANLENIDDFLKGTGE